MDLLLMEEAWSAQAKRSLHKRKNSDFWANETVTINLDKSMQICIEV